MSIPTKIEALFIRPFVKRVDEGGLIFYLVYEFERLRLLPGLDRSISNNCSSSNRTNNARAGFAPDELFGFRDASASPVHHSF